MGTDAPTTPSIPSGFPAALFSPLMWAAAAGYAAIGIVLTWVSLLLIPWGLLLLVVAFGALFAGALCAFVAAGIAELEADPA